jgi:hypothetical protein
MKTMSHGKVSCVETNKNKYTTGLPNVLELEAAEFDPTREIYLTRSELIRFKI